MSNEKGTKEWGLLAEFGSTHALYKACEKVRDAGFTRWDAHTPFPVHGLDDAMGLRPTHLPWLVLVAGLTGAGLAFGLQYWVHSEAYSLVISGKPYFAWQAYVPVTFEVMVLFAAATAVFGMLGMNRLPRFHHPLFESKRFQRFSDDRFFISIEAADGHYQGEATQEFLRTLGAEHVEVLEDK